MTKKQSQGEPKLGETIELDTSRRSVLTALGTSGVGLLGLRNAIEKVTGESAEGVPLVYTRDVHGNPERVRMVPKERYRRLKVFENLSAKSFIEKHPAVTELTIKQQSDDETDLSIHLHLEKNTREVRRQLPKRIQDVPVTYEEKDVSVHPMGCECQNPNNGARRCEDHDNLKGGIQIGADQGGWGSLCLVAWDSSGNYKKAITAYHVMDESTDDYLYQPAHSCSNDEIAADYATYDDADDIWAGSIDGWGVSGTVGQTVDAIPDVTGYWTYAGISDYTTTNSIYCFMAGAESWKREGYANSVSSGPLVEHEVDYGDENAEQGDSGSPYVDQDGKLVSMYNGCNCAAGDKWDCGTAGDYVLSKANAKLTK